MTTHFDNIKYISDGSIGEIRTITTWNVWDCKSQKWTRKPQVVLRNILLAGLHPYTIFCLGEISKTDTNPNLLNAFKPSPFPDKRVFYLDLASNSRTHGRFTFSEKTVGKKYFGYSKDDQWKRIIYGSILHTGCKKMVYKEINYIVADDENRDEDGNYLDDPVNNIHWETGDSHAKASSRIMQFLGIGDVDSGVVNPEIPLQFRAALWSEWIAKGTVAHNPMLDFPHPDLTDEGGGLIDLVIPLSSLKGNKPPLGLHRGKVLMGLVFEAEQRRAKPGWMLFQWFSFSVLEEDGIIARMQSKCQELASAYNSITDLADILKIEQLVAEAELVGGSDKLQSVAEYENTMIRIIQADRHGVLLLHPYVVRRVKERLQEVWLNLAKAAGVRFYSVMTQPDESLAHYHAVLPDGRIVGQKVFCAPDFEEGEYIVFCNPMRHWGDVQLWENRHEGAYVSSSGIMAAPRALLLSLGRDTDGDFVQLIKSSAYPNMREAIAKSEQSPIVQKLPKVALSGNLQQIAIRSMNDLTGVVASLLGRARAAGVEHHVLLIPPGGEQKEAKEMKIIDFLSQELQIAVDSLKSAYPNNSNGLDAVKKFLDEIEIEIPWLADFKNPACYRDRVCNVSADATDTISRLVKVVNSHWKSPDLKFDSSPRAYREVLFKNVEVAQFQLDSALDHRTRYRTEMAKAIQWRDDNEGDTRMIREVAEATKSSKLTILNTEDKKGELFNHQSWVAAYWRIAHEAETGDAGLVFLIFALEIVEALMKLEDSRTNVIIAYGCQHGKWSAPNWRWKGESVQIRAYVLHLSGRQHLSLEMKWEGANKLIGFHHLGIIGEKYRPFVQIGETRTMKIYTTRMKGGLMTEATLFDPIVSDEDIRDWIDPIWWYR